MRKIDFLTLFGILWCVACTKHNNTIPYKSFTSDDKSYTVEVPSYVSIYKTLKDFASFQKEENHLMITIQELKGIDMQSYMDDSNKGNYNYSIYASNDSSVFYKVTRGTGMWSAYTLYAKKKINEKSYIINVSSDRLGQSAIEDIISHIQMTMKSNDVMNESSNKVSDKISTQFKTYHNKYFSVEYPSEWSVRNNIDAMTDVYIGNNLFGFTIVRFETDYSLDEIMNESRIEGERAGISVGKDEPTKVSGKRAYRTVQIMQVGNHRVKHIAFSFKNGSMFYNVKFGDVKTPQQEKVISEVISTFKV